VCTEGVTNFSAWLNPAGMSLIKDIDPTAILIERYYHMPWAKQAMHHAGVIMYELSTLEGFCKLYEWVVNEAEQSSYARILVQDGFPYEVDVKVDSPLVGWFNVMKGVSND
jgi:CMP-2-keto-3-deoxyoctulosonic acid synthetase